MSNLIKKSSSGRTLISCTYHADKSLKSLTDVSGKTVHYGYDRLGRLERICDDNGEEIVRYGHTAGGKLKEIRHGNVIQMIISSGLHSRTRRALFSPISGMSMT